MIELIATIVVLYILALIFEWELKAFLSIFFLTGIVIGLGDLVVPDLAATVMSSPILGYGIMMLVVTYSIGISLMLYERFQHSRFRQKLIDALGEEEQGQNDPEPAAHPDPGNNDQIPDAADLPGNILWPPDDDAVFEADIDIERIEEFHREED